MWRTYPWHTYFRECENRLQLDLLHLNQLWTSMVTWYNLLLLFCTLCCLSTHIVVPNIWSLFWYQTSELFTHLSRHQKSAMTSRYANEFLKLLSSIQQWNKGWQYKYGTLKFFMHCNYILHNIITPVHYACPTVRDTMEYIEVFYSVFLLM